MARKILMANSLIGQATYSATAEGCTHNSLDILPIAGNNIIEPGEEAGLTFTVLHGTGYMEGTEIHAQINWPDGTVTVFEVTQSDGMRQVSHTIPQEKVDALDPGAQFQVQASIREGEGSSRTDNIRQELVLKDGTPADPPTDAIQVQSPALVNRPPALLVGSTLTIQVEPPTTLNPYEDLYIFIGDAADTTEKQVTNKLAGRLLQPGVYAITLTGLPVDGRALFVEVSVVAEIPTLGDPDNLQEVFDRQLYNFTAHTSSVTPNDSLIHMGAGTLITKPVFTIQSPTQPFNFNGTKDQIVNDFEYHAPAGNRGDYDPVSKRWSGYRRGFAYQTERMTFRGFYVTCAEDLDDFNSLNNSTPFEFYQCKDTQIEDFWCRGGKKALSIQACEGTKIDGAVLWAAARHSLLIHHERPHLGEWGHVDGFICYPYTHDEFRARGLRVSSGADIVNIHQALYDPTATPGQFVVRNGLIVASHGFNGSQLIQDGGDWSYGGPAGGGVLFQNIACIGGCRIAISDAGGVGAHYKDVWQWRHPDMPGGREYASSVQGPIVWFDFGRPYPDPGRIPAVLAGDGEKDINRAPQQIDGCRMKYVGNDGQLYGWNGRRADGSGGWFPNPGENVNSPKLGSNEGTAANPKYARYYGHPASAAPVITNSNLLDSSLTLAEIWAHGLAAVASVKVFPDPDMINLTEWAEFAAANPGL